VHSAWVDPDWRHRVEPSDILASLMEIPSVRISALEARVATLEGHVKSLLETKGICTQQLLVPFSCQVNISEKKKKKKKVFPFHHGTHVPRKRADSHHGIYGTTTDHSGGRKRAGSAILLRGGLDQVAPKPSPEKRPFPKAPQSAREVTRKPTLKGLFLLTRPIIDENR